MGQKVLKIVVETLRLVVGGVFAFSGFVKAIDPIGSAYKIQDYFSAFGFAELAPLALPSAIGMVVAELTLGLLLLLGVYRRISLVFIALFMVFFTPLTLWVALTNPVSDCGCFGDAFTITNWQSFSKNVVLLLSSIFLLFNYEQIKPFFARTMAIYVTAFLLVFSTLFSLYNLHREPVLDFRPFRIGVNIPEGMQMTFETIFIYSKDGVNYEFTEEEFMQSEFLWTDPDWTFVDRETRVERAGIEGFVVESLVFDEQTQRWQFDEPYTYTLLSEPRFTFIMIAADLDGMRTRQLRHFKAINRYAKQHGYLFFLLTASSLEEIYQWERRHQTGFSFLFSEQRVLSTMMRSNPGLMLLQEGTIVNKWAGSEVRPIGRLNVPLNETNLTHVREERSKNAMRLLLISLLLLLPLAILKWIE